MIKNFNDFNKFSTNEGLLDWIEKGLDKIAKRNKEKAAVRLSSWGNKKNKAGDYKAVPGPNGYEKITNEDPGVHGYLKISYENEDDILLDTLMKKLENKSIGEIDNLVTIKFTNQGDFGSFNVFLDDVKILASSDMKDKFFKFIEDKKRKKGLSNLNNKIDKL